MAVRKYFLLFKEDIDIFPLIHNERGYNKSQILVFLLKNLPLFFKEWKESKDGAKEKRVKPGGWGGVKLQGVNFDLGKKEFIYFTGCLEEVRKLYPKITESVFVRHLMKTGKHWFLSDSKEK